MLMRYIIRSMSCVDRWRLCNTNTGAAIFVTFETNERELTYVCSFEEMSTL